MSKSFMSGFVVGLIFLIVAGVGASKLQDPNKKRYEIEVADATPAQQSELTDKQRFHAKLFNTTGQIVGGKTAREWAASYKGQKIVLQTSRLGRRFLPADYPQTPEVYFKHLANDSDAIVRGRVKNKNSQFTEDDLFLFTDYDIIVSEVIKDNIASPLSQDTDIVVAGYGGKVVVDNVVLRADGNYDALLHVNTEVLVFLKFIPETGDYQLTRADAAYELNGTSARPLAEVLPLASDSFKNETSFLNTVRSVSAK